MNFIDSASSLKVSNYNFQEAMEGVEGNASRNAHVRLPSFSVGVEEN